jgi:hypothetical protein
VPAQAPGGNDDAHRTAEIEIGREGGLQLAEKAFLRRQRSTAGYDP